MNSLTLRRLGAAAGAALCLAPLAHAQTFPSKPVRAVLPYSAGSGPDAVVRQVGDKLAKAWGQQVVVDNKPGANGWLAIGEVKRAAADGYTLLAVDNTHVTLQPHLYKQLPFAPAKDLEPVAPLYSTYFFIVVPAASEVQTLADLVAKFKADPGSVSWGGGSAGGTDHILAGLIAKAAGVDPTKVNYIAHSGGGEALSAILGGHVTAGISGYEEFAPQIAAGKLRGLAISSDERLSGVDVPTLKEQGIDVSLVNWRGVFVGANVRDKDMKALSDAVGKMVESPAWQDTLKQRGWLNEKRCG